MTLLAWVVAFAATLIAVWIAFVVLLIIVRPRDLSAREAAALVPDLVRLVAALARDQQLPRRVRWRVWFLLAFIASPIDLIPDVIPVVGFLDDIVLAYFVLRSVVRAAGDDVLHRNWHGSAEGLEAIERALRLSR